MDSLRIGMGTEFLDLTVSEPESESKKLEPGTPANKSAEMAFQAEVFGMKFWHVFQAEIFGKIFPCQNSKPKFHAEIPSQNILKLSKTE